MHQNTVQKVSFMLLIIGRIVTRGPWDFIFLHKSKSDLLRQLPGTREADPIGPDRTRPGPIVPRTHSFVLKNIANFLHAT